MLPVPSPFVSEAEFSSLPRSTTKVELIDGEVVVSPRPPYWHQEVLTPIVAALRAWASTRSEPVTVAQAPLDVRFAPGRILQPDAMVLLTRLSREQEGPIDRVPELCIEVLSSDRTYDRLTKRCVYAAAGVREYWVVDPNGFVERWTGDALARQEILRDRLSSPLLPDLHLELAPIFAD